MTFLKERTKIAGFNGGGGDLFGGGQIIFFGVGAIMTFWGAFSSK